MKDYIEEKGRPLSIYVDRASHFKFSPPKGKEAPPDAETQIERALKELGVELIVARSPQAKGRVERSFRTIQDRLVKAMRVFNVTTREEADIYLAEKFIPRYNEKFSKPTHREVNAHRPKDGFELDAIFSIQEERVVANDNTFRYRGKKYQIDLMPQTPT